MEIKNAVKIQLVSKPEVRARGCGKRNLLVTTSGPKRENCLSRALRGGWGFLNHGLSRSKTTRLWCCSAQCRRFVLSDLAPRLNFIIFLLEDSIPINRNPLRGVHFVASMSLPSQTSPGQLRRRKTISFERALIAQEEKWRQVGCLFIDER